MNLGPKPPVGIGGGPGVSGGVAGGAVYAGYGGGSKPTPSTKGSSSSAPKKVERKGEVAELEKYILDYHRLLDLILRNPGDHARTRDVIKKVIAYMTIGVDVSPLFPDICKVHLRLPKAILHQRCDHQENDLLLPQQLLREEL